MVFTGYAPYPAACGVLSLFLLLAAPPSVAGEPLDGPSRGEDNRTERGNEALTGEGAWTGTLTQPVASKATAIPPQAAGRPKVVTGAKKPRVSVKRTAAARRAKPDPAHPPINLEQMRRAMIATFKGN